jgi:hypothetical protein
MLLNSCPRPKTDRIQYRIIVQAIIETEDFVARIWFVGTIRSKGLVWIGKNSTSALLDFEQKTTSSDDVLTLPSSDLYMLV